MVMVPWVTAVGVAVPVWIAIAVPGGIVPWRIPARIVPRVIPATVPAVPIPRVVPGVGAVIPRIVPGVGAVIPRIPVAVPSPVMPRIVETGVIDIYIDILRCPGLGIETDLLRQ